MHKKIIFRKVISIILCAGLLLSGGCGKAEKNNDEEKNMTNEEYESAMYTAEHTSMGRYPETITYTLAKLSGSNNSNLPEGDTYENNAYTRIINEKLNIQNIDVFESTDDQYNENVSMAIASKKIPDVMVINDIEDLKLLVEKDMIADLTDTYEECMSDTIKGIYSSYGRDIWDNVTYDGRIMAIPETNITDGPNLIWLRKDWMDKLDLEEPKTLEDVENIVNKFIEEDPGNNGEGNTIGLMCDPTLCGGNGYSSEYTLDVVFAAYGAFPKQWIYDEEGNVVYGSITDEAKEALAHIRKMYEEGILDQEFLFRTSSNIIEIIKEGKSGSFFGPWWAPNNPLMDAVANDPDANWQPYLIATDEDGSTKYHSQNPSYKYIVVRKDYEHPEIVAKMISLMFDYLRYEESDNEELIAYYQKNVDPTARPLAINVDYKNALTICYSEISYALEGKKDPQKLNVLEYSYYNACKAYLKDPSNGAPDMWAAYSSRITACKLLSEGDICEVKSLYFGTTDTMKDSWWELEELEQKTYLKIITGEIEVDDFDTFVSEWNEKGGEQITKEVQEIVDER